METINAVKNDGSVVEQKQSIYWTALLRYKDVFLSGLAVSVIIALFKWVSGKEAIGVSNLEKAITEHVFNLPMFVVDLAIFVAAFSLVASGPWGPWLRKHVVKPVLEFLLHAFGIFGGFIPVIWASDSASYFSTTALSNLGSAAVVEILALIFGFLLATGAHVCEHGTQEVLSPEELKIVSPTIRRVASFVPLPLGLYFMWYSYADLMRLSAKAALGH
jgi:hypothetical protein